MEAGYSFNIWVLIYPNLLNWLIKFLEVILLGLHRATSSVQNRDFGGQLLKAYHLRNFYLLVDPSSLVGRPGRVEIGSYRWLNEAVCHLRWFQLVCWDWGTGGCLLDTLSCRAKWRSRPPELQSCRRDHEGVARSQTARMSVESIVDPQHIPYS